MTTQAIERRAFALSEFRADAETRKIAGHAAVFDVLSDDLGGFRERIALGAFARSLAEADVRALWNHDPSLILGRNKSGTLRMREDNVGLAVEIDLPETQLARDAAELIRRGDVNQMSFGFVTRDDKWSKVDGAWVRTLLDVDLFDVSPVTFPAYPQTDVAMRGLEVARAADTRPPTSSGINLALLRRLDLAALEF